MSSRSAIHRFSMSVLASLKVECSIRTFQLLVSQVMCPINFVGGGTFFGKGQRTQPFSLQDARVGDEDTKASLFSLSLLLFLSLSLSHSQRISRKKAAHLSEAVRACVCSRCCRSRSLASLFLRASSLLTSSSSFSPLARSIVRGPLSFYTTV